MPAVLRAEPSEGLELVRVARAVAAELPRALPVPVPARRRAGRQSVLAKPTAVGSAVPTTTATATASHAAGPSACPSPTSPVTSNSTWPSWSSRSSWPFLVASRVQVDEVAQQEDAAELVGRAVVLPVRCRRVVGPAGAGQSRPHAGGPGLLPLALFVELRNPRMPRNFRRRIAAHDLRQVLRALLRQGVQPEAPRPACVHRVRSSRAGARQRRSVREWLAVGRHEAAVLHSAKECRTACEGLVRRQQIGGGGHGARLRELPRVGQVARLGGLRLGGQLEECGTLGDERHHTPRTHRAAALTDVAGGRRRVVAEPAGGPVRPPAPRRPVPEIAAPGGREGG